MVWAITNPLKGWTLYDLTTREIQLVINTMTPNEIKLARVCVGPHSKWMSLDLHQHAEIFSNTGKQSTQFLSPTDSSQIDTTDTDYFVVQPKKSFHPRLHQRIEKKIRAKILGQSMDFDSTTLDLSEGGIQFSDTIPTWVSGYFIVQIIDDTGEVYSVMCSLVEDQKEKKRVQVVSEEYDPKYVKYKNWLASLRS